MSEDTPGRREFIGVYVDLRTAALGLETADLGDEVRDSILSGDSFDEHGSHISDEDAPCSACHDPHGVSATQGNSINNSNLINFDLNIVAPNSRGLLMFEDLGGFRGQCYLSCHGEDHDPKEY